MYVLYFLNYDKTQLFFYPRVRNYTTHSEIEREHRLNHGAADSALMIFICEYRERFRVNILTKKAT